MLEDSFSSDPMLAGLAVQVHSCRFFLLNVIGDAVCNLSDDDCSLLLSSEPV